MDDWNYTLDSTGSDHIAIITTINSREIRPARQAPDWEKIQWHNSEGKMVEHLAKPLRALTLTPECDGSMRNLHRFRQTTSAQEENEVFTQNSNTRVAIVRNTAPMKRPTRWSKAWWDRELTGTRKTFTRLRNCNRRGEDNRAEADAAYKEYRKLLRKKKKGTLGRLSRKR